MPYVASETIPDADPAALEAVGYTVIEGVDYVPGPNMNPMVTVRTLLHGNCFIVPCFLGLVTVAAFHGCIPL